jgi:hypothetical protein
MVYRHDKLIVILSQRFQSPDSVGPCRSKMPPTTRRSARKVPLDRAGFASSCRPPPSARQGASRTVLARRHCAEWHRRRTVVLFEETAGPRALLISVATLRALHQWPPTLALWSGVQIASLWRDLFEQFEHLPAREYLNTNGGSPKTSASIHRP